MAMSLENVGQTIGSNFRVVKDEDAFNYQPN